MKYETRIKKIEKVRHQADDRDMVEVHVVAFTLGEDDGKGKKKRTNVTKKILGFEPTITPDELRAEVAAYAQNLEREESAMKRQKEQDDIDKNVEELQKLVVNDDE